MVVSLAYVIFDVEGNEVDRVSPAEPLSYVHGYAQIIPGLEEGVAGAELGERRTLRLPPDLAFGLRDETALLEIDRDDFPGAARVKPGDELMSEGPGGVEVPMRVLEVSPEAILVDLNHPLAGQAVVFEVEVCDLRAASDEELDRARDEIDERLVGDGTIVYGTEPGEGETRESIPTGDQLTQLRVHRAGRDEEPR